MVESKYDINLEDEYSSGLIKALTEAFASPTLSTKSIVNVFMTAVMTAKNFFNVPGPKKKEYVMGVVQDFTKSKGLEISDEHLDMASGFIDNMAMIGKQKIDLSPTGSTKCWPCC